MTGAFKAQGLGKFQKLRAAIESQRLRELGETPDEKSLDQFAALSARINAALKPN